MNKILLLSLSLVLSLAGLVTADDGFYVISGVKANFAPIPKTCQTTSYAAGDDGALQKGVAAPTPRFIDNNDGTVTDKLTGLIWMKNAGAIGQSTGWTQALSAAAALADGSHGLTDGSKAGDWRLPNIRELQSLIDYGNPSGAQFNALPANNPFTGVPGYPIYWSSTTYANTGDSSQAWYVNFAQSNTGTGASSKSYAYFIWCVRGGK